MKINFLVILCICFVYKGFGQIPQNDSILKNKADSYLAYKIGKKFKNKYLHFVFIKEAVFKIAVYETNANKREDGKNMVLVYFNAANANIDSTRHIFTKKQILNSIKGKNCNLFIGLEKAKEILTARGNKENNYPWEINMVDMDKMQIPKWAINITEYKTPNGGAQGALLTISMLDGSVEATLTKTIIN
jgi:hypothetical protein